MVVHHLVVVQLASVALEPLAAAHLANASTSLLALQSMPLIGLPSDFFVTLMVCAAPCDGINRKPKAAGAGASGAQGAEGAEGAAGA